MYLGQLPYSTSVNMKKTPKRSRTPGNSFDLFLKKLSNGGLKKAFDVTVAAKFQRLKA
jgi:hypothetical protein